MNKRSRKEGTTVPARPSVPGPGPDDALLDRISAAIPQPSRSDEDARVWLDALDDSLPLPLPLSDAAAAIASIFGDNLPDLRGARDRSDEQVQSLRRAARNGQAITPQVEDAMRRAREAAESKAPPRSEGT